MAKKKQGPKKEANAASSDSPGASVSSLLSTAQTSPVVVAASADPSSSPSSSTSAPVPALAPGNSSATASSMAAPQQSQSALIICRNKHWRYISAYHGPWLQLPREVLETLANINYNTPRPRPIDPAVFFDVAKIRRLVDEATDLSVRAASGTAQTNQPSALTHSLHQAASLGMMSGFRPGNQAKLSPERKYRIREQATQKLAKAYRLDEIACSVTIMQSTSSLEEVASFVLQRNPQDADAKYVHFFHEKIPSRQLAECTSYTALDQIIEDLPSNPEPLRTRGTVRIFKEDFHGAVADYTEALRIHRLHATSHFAPTPAAENQLAPRTGRRQDGIILKEEEHPSSLETAVLFQRAGVYLSIACQHAGAAFSQQVASEAADLPSEVTEARKLVRSNAKRALRDYTSYLSRFEYSPDLPVGIAEDFVRKVNAATTKEASRIKCRPCRAGSPTNSDNKKSNPSHRIYTVAELFASSPPSDLPPYPPSQITTAGQPADVEYATTTETVTYHPLMTESLHCLLICHCLIQTSAKELLRHAYMVARLARLSDGYPIFQTSRSPARSDWLEILRSTNNFIQLQGTWEDLCAPAPLPHFPYTTPSSQTNLSLAAQTLEIEANPLTSKAEKNAERLRLLRDAERERRQRNAQHQIVMDTLGDERVKDEESFRRALRARQLRAQKDYKLDIAVAGFSNIMARQQQQQQHQLQLQHQQQFQLADGTPDSAAAISADADSTESATNGHGAAADGSPDTVTANGSSASVADGNSEAAALARHQLHQDNDMDYPISTDRAMAVSRWVLEAPPNAGIAPGEGGAKKRKKKPAKKQSGAAVGSGDAAATGTGTVDITGEN